MKRDSQSAETHAVALKPRRQIKLPCGIVVGGGQSDTFQLATTAPVQLLWNLGGAVVLITQLVRIMRVNPNGQDHVVAAGLAYRSKIASFRPVAGALYYVVWEGAPIAHLTWFLQFPYALSLPRSVWFWRSS